MGAIAGGEFIEYLKLWKSGREPRPFMASRTLIPFLYRSYAKKEIKKAIVSFKEDGLIRQIDPIIPGETRYDITDEALKRMIYVIWIVRMFDYELLIRRLLYDRPTALDRKYLELYSGRKHADIAISQAYHTRQTYKNDREYRIEQERVIREIAEDRAFLVQDIGNRFEQVIQQNEIIRGIVEETCFSPFLPSSGSN